MDFFNRVTHQTPESVELEFTLAGIGNRAWALLIDYHILGFLLVGFLVAWSYFSSQIVEIWSNLFRNISLLKKNQLNFIFRVRRSICKSKLKHLVRGRGGFFFFIK